MGIFPKLTKKKGSELDKKKGSDLDKFMNLSVREIKINIVGDTVYEMVRDAFFTGKKSHKV